MLVDHDAGCTGRAVRGLDILDQTCYANVVEAAPIGNALENKIVKFKSQMRYRSFSFSTRQKGSQTLQCQVEFCIFEGSKR